jgi:hypothetical protein
LKSPAQALSAILLHGPLYRLIRKNAPSQKRGLLCVRKLDRANAERDGWEHGVGISIASDFPVRSGVFVMIYFILTVLAGAIALSPGTVRLDAVPARIRKRRP